jgi:EmrB/QacA subfamily drug resistance transporter
VQTNRGLVLAALVLAVAMTTIDQTIVAIALPAIQKDLALSPTAAQWVINGYLLALAALFALGGRVADLYGRRRVAVAGIVGFAVTSLCCGITPHGGIAEAWLVGFRVLQGATAALMFPAAVGIVVDAFPLHERGRAMAIFFGISGSLTAIGPISGGYLAEWTWRAIFWVNIPIAVVAIVLLRIACPPQEPQPGRVDVRGAGLVTGGMALVVLGLQQSSTWPRASVAVAIAAGLALLYAFVRWELRAPDPLLQLSIFRDRGFATETAVLGLISAVFVPFFFFASVYAQAALGEPAEQAGLYMLFFFLGFVIASLRGGRILDSRGARPAVVLGGALGTVGFILLAGRLTHLSLGAQWIWIMLAGAGIGFMLTPASTDTVNRAPRSSYSEVTGITQTVRNFGASVGLAVLGALLISRDEVNVSAALVRHAVPPPVAHHIAQSALSSGAPSGAAQPAALVHDVQLAFAHSTQSVFYVMAGFLGAAFVVAFLWLPRGRVEEVPARSEPALAGEQQLAHG